MAKRSVKSVFLIALLLSMALHAAAFFSFSYCVTGLRRRAGPAAEGGKADLLEIGLVRAPLPPQAAESAARQEEREKEMEILSSPSEVKLFRKPPETEPKLPTLSLPAGRAGESTLSSARAASEYMDAVRRRIEEAVYYPRRARLRHLEGTVRLGFRIGPAGDLLRPRVIEPSPHSDLDGAALLTLSRAAPFPGPELDLAGKEIAVSIEYKSAY